MMFSLGSKQRPIVVKIKSEEKAQKVAQICDWYGFHFIIGLELTEDLSDFKKALKDKFTPSAPYDPCLCGSGEKYKFCCAKKMKDFNIDRFIADFTDDK